MFSTPRPFIAWAESAIIFFVYNMAPVVPATYERAVEPKPNAPALDRFSFSTTTTGAAASSSHRHSAPQAQQAQPG
jgi:hypothetical protein